MKLMMVELSKRNEWTVTELLQEVNYALGDLASQAYNYGSAKDTNPANLDKSITEAKEKIKQLIIEAKVEENQRYLDNIKAFRERELKPEELTAASFGSAGAGIVESSYEHAFKDRISKLTENSPSR